MAVTVVSNLTTWNEADSTSSLSHNLSSVYPYTAGGFPRESTGMVLGQIADNSHGYMYYTGSSSNLSNTRVYVWLFSGSCVIDTKANGGYKVLIGDSTNARAYYVGGSDYTPFSVGVWKCFVLDTGNLPSSYQQVAGSGAPSLTAITRIGGGWKSLGTVSDFNVGIDVIRYGTGITVYGGTAGDPGTWAEIAAYDASTANGRALGICREIQSGVYGLQGGITFGDNSGSNTFYFKDQDATIVFEDIVNGSGTNTPIDINVVGNSSAATQYFQLGVAVGSGDTQQGRNGCNFINANITGQPVSFDASDADLDDIQLYGCKFTGMSDSVAFSSDATTSASHVISGCTFDQCAQVDLGRVTTRNCVFSGYTDDADAALLWNTNIDIKNCQFIANTDSTNDPHAIEHTASGTITYDGLTFSGNDYDVNFSGSGDLVIQNTNGSDASTHEITGAGTSVDIQTAVNVTVTVKTVGGTNIENARVLLEADTGGALPAEESCTITRSGSTATVSHTSHGLADGDYVIIRGANEQEYNGDFQITYINANSYSYTVSGTPSTPATGTITSSARIINELSNASGIATEAFNYTADQPIKGVVRKSSGTPYYQTANISGTITSSGFTTTSLLITDE